MLFRFSLPPLETLSFQYVTLSKSGSVHLWKKSSASDPDPESDSDPDDPDDSLEAISEITESLVLNQNYSGQDDFRSGRGLSSIMENDRVSLAAASAPVTSSPSPPSSPFTSPSSPPSSSSSSSSSELVAVKAELETAKAELETSLAFNDELATSVAALTGSLAEAAAESDLTIKQKGDIIEQQADVIAALQRETKGVQSALHEKWKSHNDVVLNTHAEETSKWKSHSEFLQAALAHEKEQAVAKLRDGIEAFDKQRRSSDSHKNELADEVKILRRMLVEEEQEKLKFEAKLLKHEEREMERATEGLGTVSKMVEDILKHCHVMNGEPDQEKVENKIVDLAIALERSFHHDRGTSSAVLENVRRQKLWERGEKTKLVKNIRVLVLDSEIAHVYSRQEAVKDIEELRKRTEKELTTLLVRLKAEDRAAYESKRKFTEFNDEILEVDKVVKKYEAKVNEAKQNLAMLSVTRGAAEMSKVQAKILDLSSELHKWAELKRDFSVALTQQDMTFNKCKSAGDTTREMYQEKKDTFDSGIGQAFDEAVEIVAGGADEQETRAARATRREEEAQRAVLASGQKCAEKYLWFKEARALKVSRMSPVAGGGGGGFGGGYGSPAGPGSPGVMVGTVATWARIRDKAAGRGHKLDFREFLGKDTRGKDTRKKITVAVKEQAAEERRDERDKGSVRSIFSSLQKVL